MNKEIQILIYHKLFEKEPLPFIASNFFEKEREEDELKPKKERPSTALLAKYKQSQPQKQIPLTSRPAASIFTSNKTSLKPVSVLDRDQLLKTQDQGYRTSQLSTAPKTSRSQGRGSSLKTSKRAESS